jgi:hypothetical protein
MSTTEKTPSKSSVGKKSSAKPNKQGVPAESPQERIAVTAYLLAEKRSFVPGYELQDWLEAERIIQERFP